MRSRGKACFVVIAAVILMMLAGLPVMAQGPTDLSAKNEAATASPLPDPPQQQQASSFDDSWHVDFAPYVWFPGLHGTVGALGHDASVHVSGSDVLSNFQGGIAGMLNIRKGRIVIPLDFIYAKVATTKGIPLNDLGQSQVRADVTQGIYNPAIGYRAVNGEHFKVDALFGMRI